MCGLKVLAGLSVVAGSLDHMEQVRNHATLHEPIALVVEIDPPGIASAPGEHLELVTRRDGIAKSPALSGTRNCVGRSRLANA